jgi:hypothetical protein
VRLCRKTWFNGQLQGSLATAKSRYSPAWQCSRRLGDFCATSSGTGGGDSLHSIEDVFRRISETVPQFAGLSLSKIGDLGVHILEMAELPPEAPGDCEAIEQAIEIQAARRAVRSHLDHAKAQVDSSMTREVDQQAAPQR